MAAFPFCIFQIKVNIYSAFFSTLICFTGVLKIGIAKKNHITQTEKLELILPILPKKDTKCNERANKEPRLQGKQKSI